MRPIQLHESPEADPSPMTREGTAAMVERFYALRRGQKELPTQVGVGGCLGGGSLTSLGFVPPKKSKRPMSWRYRSDRAELILSRSGQVIPPPQKTKRITYDSSHFIRVEHDGDQWSARRVR